MLLTGVLACSEDAPTAPMTDAQSTADAKQSGEVSQVSPVLAGLDARLAASGSSLRIARADIIWDAKAYDEASPTVLFANNRSHKLNYSWVPRDPRRDGRVGVTYAIDPTLTTTGFGFNLPLDDNFQSWSQGQLETRLEESMTAWRGQTCSDAPIQRVAVPAGVDPDQLDEFFLGQPVGNYAQISDIVQGGWIHPNFFGAIAPGGATQIIGVAFTFWFVDDETGQPTDIDGNGRLDTGLVEIFYNPNFLWNDGGTGQAVDFYSIITHETGHSLGLAHFGKVFVTKKDAADGISISDVKYAPKALMNAVYVTGRDEIAGSDRAAFCQLWASAN